MINFDICVKTCAQYGFDLERKEEGGYLLRSQTPFPGETECSERSLRSLMDITQEIRCMYAAYVPELMINAAVGKALIDSGPTFVAVCKEHGFEVDSPWNDTVFIRLTSTLTSHDLKTVTASCAGDIPRRVLAFAQNQTGSMVLSQELTSRDEKAEADADWVYQLSDDEALLALTRECVRVGQKWRELADALREAVDGVEAADRSASA